MRIAFSVLIIVPTVLTIGNAAAGTTNTGPYTPPTYQPKLERPEPPKTYTPTVERPQPPSNSGPTYSNRR